MQSFTTQAHQRNYQGNVVVENPHRAQPKRRKVLAGIGASVMAFAVAVTGTLLGATALHNRQLKNENHALQVQAAQVTAAMQNVETREQTALEEPTTYPFMTLEARPEDSAEQPNVDDDNQADVRSEERAPRHDSQRHHHPRKRDLRRVPISDKQHTAQPLPGTENQRGNHDDQVMPLN